MAKTTLKVFGRRDLSQAEAECLARLKAELVQAFAAPDSVYHRLDADEVIRRNALRTST
jgi:hypothetical protein